MIKRFIILLCLLPTLASAEQVRYVHEGKTVVAQVSNRAFTRLSLIGDRITKINIATNCLKYMPDGTDGSLLLIPQNQCGTSPFNLYIKTLQGKNYTVMLVPMQTPPNNVRLVATDGEQESASHWERSGPFDLRVFAIIRAMANGVPLDSYRALSVDAKPKDYNGVLSAQTLFQYQGKALIGEVVRIKNKTNKDVTVDETRFSGSGVQAVVLIDHHLPAHSETMLYRVRVR